MTAVATPVLGLAVALPAHYPYDLDTPGQLGLIYLATAVFVVGALIALLRCSSPGRTGSRPGTPSGRRANWHTNA